MLISIHIWDGLCLSKMVDQDFCNERSKNIMKQLIETRDSLNKELKESKEAFTKSCEDIKNEVKEIKEEVKKISNNKHVEGREKARDYRQFLLMGVAMAVISALINHFL